MNKMVLAAAAIALFALLGLGNALSVNAKAAGVPGQEDSPHDHDHGDPVDDPADQHDDHAGPAGGHAEESSVRLSPAERKRFGVEVGTAASGQVATQIRLPGEIVLNEDRVAHIVPRAPGVVREVLASVGDTVRAGQVMAWLESAELGEAKVDYISKWAALSGSSVDLTRAREVHHSTIRLLEELDASPSLETLLEPRAGAMGENRSILISAYTEFVFAKAAYLRERPLFEKKIASEREYQVAEAEYRKAAALYAATHDSIAFKIRRDLLEAERAQQVSEIELRGARRRLYVLGLTSDEIAEIERLAQLQTAISARRLDIGCAGLLPVLRLSPGAVVYSLSAGVGSSGRLT